MDTTNNYNIYCDESCHLQNDGIKPMGLGCIWVPKNKRLEIFSELRELKTEFGLSQRCELKWNAVSPSKLDYYKAVVDFFFNNQDVHFRSLIIADKTILNHSLYNQTHDDFYYKMYFRLLKTVISPIDNYEIYIDIKDTKSQEKVNKLKQVLANSNYDFDCSKIRRIQQVVSSEVELIQLADFLTGAVVYYQREINTSKAKLEIIQRIKEYTGYSLKKSTLYKEDKFNLFFCNLEPNATEQ